MALADLLQTLEREATGRADARLADVRAEAERLTAVHAADLATRRQQTLAAREQVLRAEGERSFVTATRDAERTRLLAHHELLARVHDRARHNLVQHAGTIQGPGGRCRAGGTRAHVSGRWPGPGPGHPATHRLPRRGQR